MRPTLATRARSRFPFLCLLLVVGWALSSTLEAQAPPRLLERVMGASKRPVVELTLNGTSFRGLAVFSDTPYVLWCPGELEEPLFEKDREAVRSWLERAGPALGHRDFTPRFEETRSWLGDEVWVYRLEREGLVLYGSEVMVEWSGRELVGLVNHVDLPLVEIEEPGDATPRDGSVVYFAERVRTGYRAVPRPVRVERSGQRTRTTVGPASTPVVTVAPPHTAIAPRMFDEWRIPTGTTFPDQIDLDANGNVWFSQPYQDDLTRFDPRTETFQSFATVPGGTPDGMTLDANGILWTGLYGGHALGRLDPTTGVHTAFSVPYSGGSPAIPKPTSAGTLWLTDHIANRISEFDGASLSWLGSYVIPTPGSWVVEGVEDPTTGTMYFTCYSSNTLAIKAPGQPIVETNTVSGGPAFPVWSRGKIYYSLWSVRSIAEYDPATGVHTSFLLPHATELGGPIGATTDGRIVVGTRGIGYIYVFDPVTQQFDSYRIPTSNAGLKDGLVVSPNGMVWFTETGADKIARLLIG